MAGSPSPAGRVGEVAALFLRLGTTAFGGPAAHVALMHDEVVRRRGWVDDQHFLDLNGATNLVPGPNSTELAIHLGKVRAGGRGMLAAGACFILPAFLMVLGLSWAYVRYGDTPAVEGVLYGVQPVIIAIVVQALAKLAPVAVRGRLLVVVFAVALVAYFLGVFELVVIGAAGVAVLAMRAARRGMAGGLHSVLTLLPATTSAATPAHTSPSELLTLFLTMLKIGAVLYGSGYVLLAFLRSDFVVRLGWLTEQQLVDGVAIGQLTPGPLFTTATFVGYVSSGWWGAVLATVAIFLPSFVFVALLGRIVPWMRAHRWARDLLDGVNVGALALMAGVAWQLGRAAVVDGFTLAILAIAAFVLWRTRWSSTWLIAAGAAIGVAHQLAVA